MLEHLHFVGINGSGMSGLARLCMARGHTVTGADQQPASATAAAFRRDGVPVGADGDGALPAGVDRVVISAAIKPEHPARAAADAAGVPVVKYAALLGELLNADGTTGVCVAGTHGKSTTTSMLAHVCISAGLDPGVIVGARTPHLPDANGEPGNFRVGSGERGGILIAESCEYDRSFHHFRPTHAAILNVEADHLDIYGSLEAVVESFRVFASQATGTLLIAHGCPHRDAIAGALDTAVETFGAEAGADWRFVHDAETGGVELHRGGAAVAAWTNAMPGAHTAADSAAAAVLAHRLGAPWLAIADALCGFRGLGRRMEALGERDGVLVLDDYAHHPTEIRATLGALAARPMRTGRLLCVFQPHQHSRTRFLLDDFADSFGAADVVLVPDIFFVRDSAADQAAVTSADLVERLTARGVDARHLPTFEGLTAELREVAAPGDLVVTMGAGPVDQIARAFLEG